MVAKRRVIEIAGMGHGTNPIPVAVRIGNMLYTGSIAGTDENGVTPTDPEAQVGQAFQNIRRILEQGEATTDDVAKVDVYLRDLSHREIVNREWVQMFPDAHNRPVRHTSRADLPGDLVLQVQIVAVI